MMSFASRTATAGAEAEVLLGLGTNLGDRAANLRAAVRALGAVIRLDALSDVYETRPWGWTEQPDFLNMAVRGRTMLSPEPLLGRVKQLEVELGRVPARRMGPRLIDIDILFYDDTVLESDVLTLPHPGILERTFVLAPVLDLSPALRHPVTGTPLAARLVELGGAPPRVGRAATVLGLEEFR